MDDRPTPLDATSAGPRTKVRYMIWTEADRNAVLDVIRADLTVDEIVELETLDDETFALFVSRLFTAVQDEFNS
jgi:hypothetical protein